MTAVDSPILLEPSPGSAGSAAIEETALEVYVQLPCDVELNRWEWHLLLKIPATSYPRIDRIAAGSPWRWVRYACGAILGTEHGRLSSSKDAIDELWDDDAPQIQLNSVFFHVPEAERGSLLSVEPDLCANRFGAESSHYHRTTAEVEVCTRDGYKCVCSEVPRDMCALAHLIPHVKGDLYITELTAGAIRDIDDNRNVILLQQTLHAGLGKSFAIMPKPNFAYPDSEECWEPHLLNDARIDMENTCRVPADRVDWPPKLLFNQVYAAAVLNMFSPDAASRAALDILSRRYYGDADQRDKVVDKKSKGQRQAEQKAARLSTRRDDLGNETNDHLDAIESQLPLWTVALPAHTRREFCEQIYLRRQEANHSRVADWLADV